MVVAGRVEIVYPYCFYWVSVDENSERTAGGPRAGLDATSAVALLAGLSAGWITFVNTFKHEHLHIPPFQLGQGAHAVAFPGFSFTPEARHIWPAFIALVALLLIDVQLATRSRLRQESSRRQSDRRQARAIDRSAQANLAVLRALESLQVLDEAVPPRRDPGIE